MPNVRSFIIIQIDSYPELLLWKSISAICNRLGEKFPGHRDCALFEVIAEGEISTHLEEGGMSSRLTNFINIQGTNAFLN